MTNIEIDLVRKIADLSEHLRSEIQKLYAEASDPILGELAYVHLRTDGTLNSDLERIAKNLE